MHKYIRLLSILLYFFLYYNVAVHLKGYLSTSVQKQKEKQITNNKKKKQTNKQKKKQNALCI